MCRYISRQLSFLENNLFLLSKTCFAKAPKAYLTDLSTSSTRADNGETRRTVAKRDKNGETRREFSFPREKLVDWQSFSLRGGQHSEAHLTMFAPCLSLFRPPDPGDHQHQHQKQTDQCPGNTAHNQLRSDCATFLSTLFSLPNHMRHPTREESHLPTSELESRSLYFVC